jgi:hypothetical protein
MGQEFFINSEALESKIRTLLPSQGGAGAGFDLSASTQIVPVIDLTESAEGSNIRADLQTAFSLKTITSFQIQNSTTTIINTTGYYRVYGCASAISASGDFKMSFEITDGTTTKEVIALFMENTSTVLYQNQIFDFNIFLEAGESLTGIAQSTSGNLFGCTRQIASIDGTLTNP